MRGLDFCDEIPASILCDCCAAAFLAKGVCLRVAKPCTGPESKRCAIVALLWEPNLVAGRWEIAVLLLVVFRFALGST